MITQQPPKDKYGYYDDGRYGACAAAKLLGVNRHTLNNWISTGRKGVTLRRHTYKNINRDFYLGSDIQKFWEQTR